MLLRLLRLFPAFVALEKRAAADNEATAQVGSLTVDLVNAREELNQLVVEKQILEDRLETALADHDRMWQALQSAIDNERFALRTQINHLTQKAGAGTPYQDAHRIPESALPRPQVPGPVGRRGRVLSSQLVQQQTMQNLRRMNRLSHVDDGDIAEVIAQ